MCVTVGYLTAEKPKLKYIFKELKPLESHWKSIGVFLDIDPNDLDRIESERKGVMIDCLREMLSWWLKQVNLSPTWNGLIDAVEEIDERKAEELRKKVADGVYM